MVRCTVPIVLACLGCVLGCFGEGPKPLLVPQNPFRPPADAPPPTRTAYTPAATDVAARVDQVGRNILAANPQVGVRPLFRTIGSPQTEIFHRGSAEINLTEGLVRQCATDKQLAAVLCLELGKIVSERQALASPVRRSQERLPPMEVSIRTDSASDQTHLAELARYEKEQRRSGPATLPPDPHVLARTYLANAGFAATDLDDVAPLLRNAGTNSALEKQLAAPAPARPWIK